MNMLMARSLSLRRLHWIDVAANQLDHVIHDGHPLRGRLCLHLPMKAFGEYEANVSLRFDGCHVFVPWSLKYSDSGPGGIRTHNLQLRESAADPFSFRASTTSAFTASGSFHAPVASNLERNCVPDNSCHLASGMFISGGSAAKGGA